MQTEEQLRENANDCIEEIRSANARLTAALLAGDIDQIAECASLLGMFGVTLITLNEVLK